MMAAAMELGLLPSHGELCLQHIAENMQLKNSVIMVTLHTQCIMSYQFAHTQRNKWQHAECLCQKTLYIFITYFQDSHNNV